MVVNFDLSDFLKKIFSGRKEKSLRNRVITSLILGVLTAVIVFYIFLPPINIFAEGFWVYLLVVILAFSLPLFRFSDVYVSITEKGGKINKKVLGSTNKWLIIAILVPIVVLAIGSIISSPIFNARRYASIIEVKDSDFATDLPETSEVTNIALMDTDSAMILGNRTLGSLSHVVSQYTVSSQYTQINYKNTPKKVTNLEYDGFFKWIGNRENGIPGMVIVDPVKSSAEYIELKEPMHYVESGYFGDDLLRKLRFKYPTKIFDYDSISFEIDDEGNPYYIVSCYKPRVALFGARDVSEVIIFDPTDASSEIYDVKDTPSWVDIVYDGNLATDKYNWHGTLSGGYINSIIGNVGCKMATDDFGYIVIEDDVWYFTGVTSAVSNDKSNIGFILSNARTGEYKFYSVIGAEEHSAMDAAEGEIQEKGYVASFPSLVNVMGQPTYIMVLKNNAGIVERYALVNVQNYSLVAIGTTQAEAMAEYKKVLNQSNVGVDGNEKTIEITVKDVEIVMLSGAATVYIKTEDSGVFKGYLESDEALMLIDVGDKLKINYTTGDIENIFIISSWEFVK